MLTFTDYIMKRMPGNPLRHLRNPTLLGVLAAPRGLVPTLCPPPSPKVSTTLHLHFAHSLTFPQ